MGRRDAAAHLRRERPHRSVRRHPRRSVRPPNGDDLVRPRGRRVLRGDGVRLRSGDPAGAGVRVGRRRGAVRLLVGRRDSESGGVRGGSRLGEQPRPDGQVRGDLARPGPRRDPLRAHRPRRGPRPERRVVRRVGVAGVDGARSLQRGRGERRGSRYGRDRAAPRERDTARALVHSKGPGAAQADAGLGLPHPGARHEHGGRRAARRGRVRRRRDRLQPHRRGVGRRIGDRFVPRPLPHAPHRGPCPRVGHGAHRQSAGAAWACRRSSGPWWPSGC